MKRILLQLIGVSLIQSILTLMIQDERTGKLLKLIGGTAMATILISGIISFDYRAYAAALQRTRTERQWDAESVKTDVEQFNRRYIESKCAAYILEKASEQQIRLSDAKVSLAWHLDGYWYPVHAEMKVSDPGNGLSALQQLIECELGIPLSEQNWIMEDEQIGPG